MPKDMIARLAAAPTLAAQLVGELLPYAGSKPSLPPFTTPR